MMLDYNNPKRDAVLASMCRGRAETSPPIVTQDDRITRVRWSPDGSRLAVAGKQTVGLLDLQTDRVIARICASTTWVTQEEWRTRVSPSCPTPTPAHSDRRRAASKKRC
jgi:hypothetical protein